MSVWQDFVFGARLLVKKPGFTAVAAASLALGIGANTVIFSLINGLLLRPLDYPDADRVVWVWTGSEEFPTGQNTMLYPNFNALREQGQSFEVLGGYWGGVVGDLGASEDGKPAEKLQGQHFTQGVFEAVGVQPALGRTFTREEDRVDNIADVLVISDGLWQRRFGGDPGVLGKTLRMDGTSYTVIGVMPPGFEFFDTETDFWKPVPVNTTMAESPAFAMAVIARLKQGVRMEQAQAEMAAFAKQRTAANPELNKGITMHLQTLQEGAYGGLRDPLLILQGAVGFVLLIGCANVAGLLLARAASRRTEIALRTAIGAGRGRVVRQLVTESVPLSLLGGALGVLLAWGGLKLFVAYSPAGFLQLTEFPLDWRVLAFTAAVAVVTSVVFGIVPAVQASKTDLASSLKESSRSGSDAAVRQHLRSALVTLQIALALVLLIGAGLMINSFLRVQGNQLGADPKGLLSFEIRFSQSETITPFARHRGAGLWDVNPQTTLSFERVLERMRSLPGAVAIAGASHRPFSGSLQVGFLKSGQTPSLEGQPGQNASYVAVTENYFSTLRVPILQGRDFNDRDTSSGPPVVIVNQAFADRYFQKESALGQYIRVDYVPDEPSRQIVGVAGNIRLSRAQREFQPIMYLPYRQQTPRWLGPGWAERAGFSFLLRSPGDPMSLVPAMRGALAEVEPDKPAGEVIAVEQYLDQQVQYERLYVMLLAVFGGIAAVLAAIGIYGVMAYAVAERTREIGIRMALGASAATVMKLVVRRALILVAIGLAIGIGSALALTRLIESQLWGITATDPLTYAVVSGVLALVAVAACIVPTRRAVAVDPTVALRYE